MPTPEQVVEALKKVKFPGLSRDIVSFGFVHDVQVNGGDVSFRIQFQSENAAVGQQVARDAEAAVRKIDGVRDVHAHVDVSPRQAAAPGMSAGEILPEVRFKIAVASGRVASANPRCRPISRSRCTRSAIRSGC